MANLLLEEERFIIFDTRNEYDPHFFEGEISVVNDMQNFLTALNDAKQKIIFKFDDDEQFSAALRQLYEFQKQNADIPELPPVRISIDELNRFADTHNAPESLREIIQRGRDYKINKLLGAQWFGTIPTWIRDSFSEIYTFRHSDPRGLALLELYGFEKEEVRELPQYQCLHNSKTGIEKIILKAQNEK
jgi:hypothetical protein